GAGEKQESVKPLLAEGRVPGPCQILLGLAAQGGKGCKGAVRIENRLALLAGRTLAVGPVGLFGPGRTLVFIPATTIGLPGDDLLALALRAALAGRTL